MTDAPRARSSTMRAAGILLLFTLLLPTAGAHAVLLTATPPPNGHIDVGARVVEFVFTEDVEREYTSADVVDLSLESVAAGPVAFDATHHNVLRLPVTPLADGIYSASWKALSVDTHTTRGSFVFAVGNATLRPGQYEAVVDEHPAGEIARDGFARFAFYLGLFLVIGMPLFALVVLGRDPPRSLFATAASFGIVGAVGALVGVLFLADRTGLGLATLDTAPGRSFLARGALLAAGATACFVAAATPARWKHVSIAALAFGAFSLFATATGSHAAAAKEWTSLLIAADALHLLMGAIWIGGIAGFLHTGWGRGAREIGLMVTRFSPFAVGSVILLLITGTIASFAHMPCTRDLPFGCIEALRTESYVQLVALKIALMLPLIAIGAYNKRRLGPRLLRGEGEPRVFRRIIQAEALTMVLILGAAGILASSAPPTREVETGEGYMPYIEMENTTRLSHVIVQIYPNPVTVGVQKLIIIVHPLGERLPNGTMVAFKVWPQGEREPEITTEIPKVTPNEWETESGIFTSAGEWNLLVLLDRGDEFVKLPFKVPVVNPSSS